VFGSVRAQAGPSASQVQPAVLSYRWQRRLLMTAASAAFYSLAVFR